MQRGQGQAEPAGEREVLRWDEAPSAGSRAAGLGCALVLLCFGLVGAVGAAEGRDWGSLFGLPFLLLVVAAISMVSLARTVVRVVARGDGPGGTVHTERHVLGRRVGGQQAGFGDVQRVEVAPLQAGGRTLWRVRLVGARGIDVVATTDEAEARALAAQLEAALVG